MKLKTELEVLTTKRGHFRNKLGCIDKEMTDCITNEATSNLVRKEIEEKWVKDSIKFGKVISNAERRPFRKVKVKLEM